MSAAADVLHDAVHLLRAMGDADGEDEEGHQYRVGVEHETQQAHQTELPGDGDDGTGDDQQGAAHTAGIEENQRGTDQGRERKVGKDLDQAVDQVTDQLRKADDMNLNIVFLVFDANGVDGIVKGAVIERLAGRIMVQQRHEQHGRVLVIGHQIADQACPLDVGLHRRDAFRRSVVGVRNYCAALVAFGGNFGPAHHRHPQRLHEGAVDAGHQKHRVVDVAQGLQELLAIDVALGVFDDNAQRVAQTLDLRLVGLVVFDEGMRLRHHLLEAGVDIQPRSLVAEESRQQRADNYQRQAVVEDEALQGVAGARIKVFPPRNDGHRIYFG